MLRPRLGQRIEDSAGRRSRSSRRPGAQARHRAGHRQAILDGLRAAASEPGGTSTAVFEGFPIPIAGKTGTAEKGAGRADQSWYVALAPYPDPKYVVAVTFEAGGFGAETAAPAARQILAELFGVEARTRVVAGGERARLMHASAASAPVRASASGVGPRPADRPAAAARVARPARVQHLHHRLGHPGRHPGDPNFYVFRQAATPAWAWC